MPGSSDLLVRQLTVLRRCADGSQRFSHLRRELGVPASTLQRLLTALRDAGLVRGDGGGYALAPGATALALDLLDHGRPAGAAQPAVAALARQTGASACFWILDGRRLILLAKQEVAGGFHYLDRFAHRPPESSVFGAALLAALAPGDAARHLRRADARFVSLVRGTGADGCIGGTVASEPGFWRLAAPVRCGGQALGAVGVSRHRQPDAATARRDRTCVLAAARRLAADLAEDG